MTKKEFKPNKIQKFIFYLIIFCVLIGIGNLSIFIFETGTIFFNGFIGIIDILMPYIVARFNPQFEIKKTIKYYWAKMPTMPKIEFFK